MGDSCWQGDYLAFNDTKLWDGTGDPLDNDVWNSQSLGMPYDGVDIDTFDVTWASGLLEPGDTTAHLDMQTDEDHWNLIYIILSLRSETITGSTTHYVIRSN